MLSSCACHLWVQFLRHEQISQNPRVVAMMPPLVETVAKAVMKVKVLNLCELWIAREVYLFKQTNFNFQLQK